MSFTRWMALGLNMSKENAGLSEREFMNNDADITDEELQAIQDLVDAEIEAHGLPTDDELRQEIENMNQQLTGEGSDRA